MRPTITIPTSFLEGLIAASREQAPIRGADDCGLSRFLGRLRDDQLAELVALRSIGYSADGEMEWAGRLQEACALNGRQKVACLLATENLGELIEDGLIEIGCGLLNELELTAA